MDDMPQTLKELNTTKAPWEIKKKSVINFIHVNEQQPNKAKSQWSHKMFYKKKKTTYK